jgi:hypothetical protein
LFADDSNLITSGKSPSDIEQTINDEIPILINWLQTNRLSLNLKRKHIMMFGPNKKTVNNNILVKIDGVPIEIVHHTKFLGIILDDKLTWKEHINYISKNNSKSIGILSRARPLLKAKCLHQLYYSFLYPYINYCIIIWGQASASTLWPIFKLQKRAVRIISNIKQRDSSKAAFKKLRILRLPELHTFAIMIFMFKYKNGHLPPTFDDFYSENQLFHRYPTRGAKNLRTPRVRTKIASSFIKKTGADLWNMLSPKISNCNKIRIFKKELITLLISDYSNLNI